MNLNGCVLILAVAVQLFGARPSFLDFNDVKKIDVLDVVKGNPHPLTSFSDSVQIAEVTKTLRSFGAGWKRFRATPLSGNVLIVVRDEKLGDEYIRWIPGTLQVEIGGLAYVRRVTKKEELELFEILRITLPKEGNDKK